MPFYFRKSIGSGPFRVNLSGRGVGVSVGVKGFRVGTGPRGAYVRAGRDGFYYQQYLSKGRQARSYPSANGSSPTNTHGTLVSGTPVEFVGEEQTTADAFISDLNSRRKAFRWSGLTFAIAALLLFLALAGQWVALVFSAIFFVGSAVLRVAEGRSREISITYELDDKTRTNFEALSRAFADAGSSSRVWRVLTQAGVADGGKRHAGATKLVNRTITRVELGASDVKTNVRAPSVTLQAARLHFLPDRILVVRREQVLSVRYSDVVALSTFSHFRETDPKPMDATLVGSTWVYVNRNGTPDKRFNNNRQIPIFEYSELSLESTVVSFLLQFSKRGVSDPLAAAIRRCAAA